MRGTRVVVYLDDGLGMAAEVRASETSKAVENTLLKPGFVPHVEKSKWKPSKCLQWLGFQIDLSEGQICVPDEKFAKLKALLESTMSQSVLPARSVARLTGKIMSMWLGLGSIVRLMTRGLYRLLETRVSWYDV